jgi:hypothetical protein
MTLADIETHLYERGWVATDLPDPAPVFAARDALLGHLRKHLPDLARLDDYHLLVKDRERHVAVLHDAASWYWREQLGRSIIAANLDLFRRLAGADLHVQNRPYLRAVRPGCVEDAAPMHRDTYYGASPYEVSILVPFTDIGAAGAMRVVSGSHLSPDSDYPFVQHVSPDVVAKSPKHELGFPYAPKLLDPSLTEKAEPVPLAVGQVLIFGLSLVHGGGVNNGDRTRFSSDIRIVNSLAPVKFSRGVDASYFVPLCSSVVTRTARQYEATKSPMA